VACALVWAPHTVVDRLTKWSLQKSPAEYELAVRSVRTMGPAVIGLSLGSTTYVLLNGYKRFFLAAFGDAVWKFCVGASDRGRSSEGDGARMLMWGLVAGRSAKSAPICWGFATNCLCSARCWTCRIRRSNVCAGWRCRCWPASDGEGARRIHNVYVLSALNESGLMQANSMGKKLQSTLLFLVPYTLSIAVFPYFCELVDRKDFASLGRLVTRFGRMLLALFVPFALFVAVAAVPLTSLIFKGGQFDATAVQRTAVSLSFYTFMLPAAAIEMLVMQAFFANRRMVSVTLIGIFFSLFSMTVSWLGLKFWGGRDLVVLAVIAGGFTLARTFKCVALVEMLKKNAPVFPFAETAAFLLRLAVAAAWRRRHVAAAAPRRRGDRAPRTRRRSDPSVRFRRGVRRGLSRVRLCLPDRRTEDDGRFRAPETAETGLRRGTACIKLPPFFVYGFRAETRFSRS
jgi:peptidoglycan biosynthesis protein MviN/MurJ (putative lipid II flippase)